MRADGNEGVTIDLSSYRDDCSAIDEPTAGVAGVKRYRLHQCSHQHRTLNALLKCLWPRAAWYMGAGRFASLAHCRSLTVFLYPTLEEAEDAKAGIDRIGCGGGCDRRHEVVSISGPAGAVPESGGAR